MAEGAYPIEVDLPRRPYLGVALEGRLVVRVVPGSPADDAGLVVGDEVLSPVGPIVQTTRGEVRTRPRPMEEGARYDHVTVGPHRLRTITRSPENPWGSVLFVQGIGLASIELHPKVTALCRAFEAAGLRSMRIDKRGVGDSEGPPADFDAEFEGARAALAALPEPAFVFGHSVGGMIAPMLGRPCVVYGTAATRWRACLAASTRRQLRARGVDEARIEAAVKAQARGLDEGDERSPEFHAQLDATDLFAAWRALEAPALVLHGERDLVVGEDEGRAIAETARFAEFRVVPGLDHEIDPSLADLVVAYLARGREHR